MARLETRVKRAGQWTREVIFLVKVRAVGSRHSFNTIADTVGDQVSLSALARLIESRLHHCLDMTMQEDLSRVRTPNSAWVLGMIRRVVLSLSNATVDRARKANPKTKFNTKKFQQRFRSARGGRERLQALVFAKNPALRDLAK